MRTAGALAEPRPVEDLEVERLAPVVARWAYAAGARYEDWRFGGRAAAVAELEHWVRRPGSELAVRRWRVCFDEGRPVGGVSFLPGDDLVRARRADLLALAGRPDAAALRERLGAVRLLFAAVAPEDMYLSRIAVEPEHRGRGLGRRLVHEVVKAARSEGCPRIRLDVDAENEAALALYDRLGFALRAEAVSDAAGLRYQALELLV